MIFGKLCFVRVTDLETTSLSALAWSWSEEDGGSKKKILVRWMGGWHWQEQNDEEHATSKFKIPTTHTRSHRIRRKRHDYNSTRVERSRVPINSKINTYMRLRRPWHWRNFREFWEGVMVFGASPCSGPGTFAYGKPDTRALLRSCQCFFVTSISFRYGRHGPGRPQKPPR